LVENTGLDPALDVLVTEVIDEVADRSVGPDAVRTRWREGEDLPDP
jgi:hypothetical protein